MPIACNRSRSCSIAYPAGGDDGAMSGTALDFCQALEIRAGIGPDPAKRHDDDAGRPIVCVFKN